MTCQSHNLPSHVISLAAECTGWGNIWGQKCKTREKGWPRGCERADQCLTEPLLDLQNWPCAGTTHQCLSRVKENKISSKISAPYQSCLLTNYSVCPWAGSTVISDSWKSSCCHHIILASIINDHLQAFHPKLLLPSGPTSVKLRLIHVPLHVSIPAVQQSTFTALSLCRMPHSSSTKQFLYYLFSTWASCTLVGRKSEIRTKTVSNRGIKTL